jgi:AraC-like DNA-binding protein
VHSRTTGLVSRWDKPRTPESGPWAYSDLNHLHFPNTDAIEHVLQSLVTLFTEEVPGRDLLIDLNASQLIVRMLQTESRMILMDHYEKHPPSNGLAAAVHYARKHLSRQVTVSDLAEKACMSESSFYRYFKNEFGMTPLQFLTRERMKRAQQMLKDRFRSVSEVSHDIGFSSVSYFINTFKQHVGQTPKQYQLAQCEG